MPRMPHSPPSTWLFDLDGTIVDSRAPILQSLNHAFAAWDLPILTDEELDPYVGPPLQTTLADTLRRHRRNEDGAVALLAEFRSHYQHACIELAVSYDGMPEVLETLSGDHRLAVVTSKTIVYARPILEALDLARWFDHIEGPDPAVPETKPVTMKRAIEALTLDPSIESTVMIGDRLHDIEAAAEHGIPGVGVTWGFGDRTELVTAGAEHIVDRPVDLLTLF